MDFRSLIHLILKTLGVLFIWNILEAFSRFLSVLIYMPQYSTEKEAYFNLGVTIPPILLYSLFSWLLIFRTNSLIDLFRLDKKAGAGEGRTFHLDQHNVVRIALLIISGWVLVNELPEFFRHAVYYYQERRLYRRIIRPDISYISMSAFKILLALTLIVFNHFWVNLLLRLSQSNLRLRRR